MLATPVPMLRESGLRQQPGRKGKGIASGRLDNPHSAIAQTFDLASELRNLRPLHRIKKYKHPRPADIHLHSLAFINEFVPHR
jgi:hypothetical protein